MLSKAGADVPPLVLIGVPLTVGLGAYLLQRSRGAGRAAAGRDGGQRATIEASEPLDPIEPAAVEA